MDERIELLVTVVVAAEDDAGARDACAELTWQFNGRIVEVTDCSAEEPGCRAVTVLVLTDETVAHNLAAALARAVRRFVRELGPGFTMPRVACEPPTAWTVIDDPDALAPLVPRAERLLIEAWAGDPYRSPQEDPEPEPPPVPAPEPVRHQETASTGYRVDAGYRLTLRVEVATARSAGAEWQARAVASRISRAATLTSVVERDGVLSVKVDLGPASVPPPQAVLSAMSALDRGGWSPLRWEGEVALTRWVADPRPASGIVELELSAGPNGKRGGRHRKH